MCHFDSDKNTKDVSGIGGTKPMKKLVLGACLAIMLGFIGGCAWAPGGHIDYRTTADTDLDDQVDIVPITPSLISTYRAQNGEPKARPMPPELIREIEDYQYRVGSGDVLNIIVYDHPELTIPAGSERSAAESGTLVHAGGTIYYPFVGTIQVAGRTVGEIRQILTNRLSTYITDPQVEVSVAAFRSKKFYVSGSVNSPGVQPITNVPMTVLDAISQAGGPTDDANWHHVALTRDGRETALSIFEMLHNGDLSRNTLMQSGDILHVSSSDNQRISVLGQVLSPGHISTGRERLSLTDALSRAGGGRRGPGRTVRHLRHSRQSSRKRQDGHRLPAGYLQRRGAQHGGIFPARTAGCGLRHVRTSGALEHCHQSAAAVRLPARSSGRLG